MSAISRWLVPRATEHVADRWRKLCAVGVAVYLVARVGALTATQRAEDFDGVGVLRFLESPLPQTARITLWAAAICACISLAAGKARTAAAVAAAVTVLLLTTHRSSFGVILWFDVLPVIHLILLAAMLVAMASVKEAEERLLTIGWGLRLAALATVATYVVSGITKIQLSGVSWAQTETLQTHIAFSAARAEVLGAAPSPIAGAFIRSPLAGFAGWMTLALELGAPVALASKRLAVGWSIAMWIVHLGIAATMFVIFHWPLLGLAFYPVAAIAGVPLSDPNRSPAQ